MRLNRPFSLATIISGSVALHALGTHGTPEATPDRGDHGEVRAALRPEPGHRSRKLAASPIIQDPIAVAWGAEGAVWVVDAGDGATGSIVVLREAPDAAGSVVGRVFLDQLVRPMGVVPLGRTGALVLEPPYLLLATDRDGDGRADSTRTVAGGLAGARGMSLLSDGTLVFPGSSLRYRWDGERVQGQRSTVVNGAALAEAPDGALLVAEGGAVGATSLALPVPAARHLPTPLSMVALAPAHAGRPAPMSGIAALDDGTLLGAVQDGSIRPLEPRPSRWNWSEGHAPAPAWATTDAMRAIALAPAGGGAVLVAVGATTPSAGDGSVWLLDAEAPDEAGARTLAAPTADLLAQLASSDRQWRRSVREAVLVAVAEGSLDRAEVVTAVRALALSHASGAVRRECWSMLDRLRAVDGGDLERARHDPDPTVRQLLARTAGKNSPLLEVLRVDSDPAVRAEAALAVARMNFGDGDGSAQELRALFNQLVGDLSLDAAITAIAGVASGEEEAFLAALMPDATTPEPLLAALADGALSQAGPADRRRLLERGSDPSLPSMTASVVLERIAAAARLNDRRPARITLDAKPDLDPTNTLDATRAALRARLDPQLRWPGRSDVVDEALPLDEILDEGRRLYANCVVCHGAAGAGQVGVYPPLAGSEFVAGNPERFARILLHGLEGRLDVKGRSYAGLMPKPPLSSDEEIAAVMTYVRQAFGNRADPVSAALVRQVRDATKDRTKPWTADELAAP